MKFSPCEIGTDVASLNDAGGVNAGNFTAGAGVLATRFAAGTPAPVAPDAGPDAFFDDTGNGGTAVTGSERSGVDG